MKIAVLGNGRVGSEITRRLRKRHEVNVFDLTPGDNVTLADLGRIGAVSQIAREHTVVVGALPSSMGFRTMQAVVETGTDMVDISFMEQDASELHDFAQQTGARVVADMGIAPGVSNVLVGSLCDLGYQDVTVYVGGIPDVATWPIYHSTGFNLEDTLSEYTRQVRQVENGHIVKKAPLGGYETLRGGLEAFETDGLRSLAELPFRELKEKTLRWNGHHAFILQIKQAGFLADLAVAAKCLDKAMKPVGEEQTILRVEAYGMGAYNSGPRSFVYKDQRPQSLAISTAIPAVVAVEHLESVPRGVWMPEDVFGFDPFLTWLEDEGLIVEERWT